MSGKPYSNASTYHNIHKVKKLYEELKEQIRLSHPSLSLQEKWFAQMHSLKQYSFHNSVCVFLWDVVSNRFLIAIDERNVLQYDMSLYTAENGVDFSLANFHPAYIHAIQLMNQCIMVQLNLNPHIPVDKISASFDALYRVKDGNYLHMVQQIVPVETDSNGKPFLFLSYVRDVTHLKKQPSSSLVFTTPDESKLWKYCFQKNELEVVMPFTTQEKKILLLLSEGKQTRQIADMLSVSRHTIDTHRRNMLAKTSCIDSTALIVYCHMIGLI